jgi:hypothetical protein
VEKWIKELPRSRISYPSANRDRLKYWFWRVYTPLHPFVRDTSTLLGIVKHAGRQEYLVGSLKRECSLRDFISFLIEQGFANHFIAWKDTGELVSLRKTVGFEYQYHVRVFNDGEVRCHYEYTPEYRPVRHLIQVGFEDRIQEFRDLLRDWVH